jgi:hypothetical protein
MNDLEVLARTLWGESEVDDLEDARAIAHVAVNRAAMPNWPDTVREVCLQPMQFSCWNSNNPRRGAMMVADRKNPWFRDCWKVAETVLSGDDDPTKRSTHYHATYVKPRWAKGKTPVYQSPWGKYNHLFFNDIDTPPPRTAAEALDQSRPLGTTRTVRAGKVATVSTAGTAGIEAVQQGVVELTDAVQPLVQYLEIAQWVLIGLTLIAVLVGLYARFNDREEGRR